MDMGEAEKALQSLLKRAVGKIGFRLDGVMLTAHCMTCDGEVTIETEISHAGDERLYHGLLKFYDAHEHKEV